MDEAMNPEDIEKEEEALLIERKSMPLPQIPMLIMEPQRAEPEEPVPSQLSPLEADETANRSAKTGTSLPISHVRPQTTKPMKEDGSVIVAKELAGQMGSAPEIKQEMRIDERKFAVLQDGTLAALSHFSYRYVYDKVRYWGHITEWWLTGSQGIGGLARKHVLQLMANSSGVQSIEKAQKPNVVARALWNRDWRRKAEQKGEVVEE